MSDMRAAFQDSTPVIERLNRGRFGVAANRSLGGAGTSPFPASVAAAGAAADLVRQNHGAGPTTSRVCCIMYPC
jgi:hypothetical protein